MLPQRGKLSKACVICHKKKIKCDLTETNQPCTNCRNGDYTCRPHQRKRKHYSVSPVSPYDSRLDDRRRSQGSHTGVELTRSSHVGPSPASIADFGTSPATYVITEDENSAAAAAIGLQHLRNNPSASTQQTAPDESSPQDKPVTGQTYVGRSDYIGGHQVPFSDEVDVPSPASSPKPGLADIDLRFLQLKKAFDLPPRTIRTSLIDAFMEWCHPWMPIVERQWLDDPKPSLLLQSVFLAGSRVLSSPLVYASSKDYYDRAKTLFFQGHERNTLLSIVAVCLLQWWNPTGPEKVSTSTSGFWIRIGVALAYQVGLHMEPADGPFRSFRRRLWWSLVCRDCIISVGVGRPRAINLEDATVKPPSVEDFPVADVNARLFVAYVSICRQMGDIAEAHRRRTLTPACQQRCENALFRWLKELPPSLRLFQGDRSSRSLAPYNFEARQLAVPYFVSLIILHKHSNRSAAVPTTCLMASSFVVGIFEDFISRDQLRYLGPVFAFYALAAGLVQLTGYRYEAASSIAEHAFGVIRISLEQLGQRWGSAHGALRALCKAKEAILRQPHIQSHPTPLPAEAAIFFEDLGPDLCRHWHLGGVEDWAAASTQDQAPTNADTSELSTWDYERNGVALQPGIVGQESMGPFQASTLVPEASIGFDEMQLFDELQVPMGSWLLEDYETFGL